MDVRLLNVPDLLGGATVIYSLPSNFPTNIGAEPAHGHKT